ncbi:MAG: hypothetical protein IMF19_04645 [Proteobacteria bacterium]|nr:hypothetical protein [Pseudomonadota bacterium]
MAAKRMTKVIEGTVLKIKEIESNTDLTLDFAKLPPDIQFKFGPFGLSHRIGDAAAGKKGKEAIEAMNKVWNGLMEGNWTVRAPAGEKLTKKGLTDKIDQMAPKEQTAAKALLEKLGLSL